MGEKEGLNDPDKIQLVRMDGKEYEVPIGGSVSLLALGYRGLMIWREKLAQALPISQKRAE